jgi:ATP-binding cassette subfamily B protein
VDKRQKSQWETIKDLAKFFKPHRKQVIQLSVLMILVGLLDAVSPYFSKYAIDTFIETGSLDHYGAFAAVYLTQVVLLSISVYWLIYLADSIGTQVSYDVRKRGFENLQELSFSYYDRTKVGWIMARMTSDIGKITEGISWALVDLIWGITMIVAILAIMFITNWRLTMIMVLLMPVLILVSYFFQNRILKQQRRVRRMNSRITGAFSEGIMGARTTKSLVREEKNIEEFEALAGNMRNAAVRSATFSAAYIPIVFLINVVGQAFILIRGGSGVLAGQISYGTLVAFISYAVLMFEPVHHFAVVMAQFQETRASAERVVALLEEEPDIRDLDRIVAQYGTALKPKRENWPNLDGEIDFDHVSFAYNPKEPVLDDFTLKVKEGETIALVGETGSGKSTIVNLACRFYEPTEGEIRIDGVDIRERSQLWLHDHLGYVLQQPMLFSGTIRDNIRFGRASATDEEIQEAAKHVHAHDFIDRLPKGYDTEVGEGGAKLSTGQKQLISFARAILKNPKIFILDEATSSIDLETELQIQKATQAILKGRTSFIIAHRLSTIVHADKILVLQDGKIAEAGNHHELMKSKGIYYELYLSQFDAA